MSEDCTVCAVDARPESRLVQFQGDEESVWFTWFNDVYFNLSEAFGHHLLSHLVERRMNALNMQNNTEAGELH